MKFLRSAPALAFSLVAIAAIVVVTIGTLNIRHGGTPNNRFQAALAAQQARLAQPETPVPPTLPAPAAIFTPLPNWTPLVAQQPVCAIICNDQAVPNTIWTPLSPDAATTSMAFVDTATSAPLEPPPATPVPTDTPTIEPPTATSLPPPTDPPPAPAYQAAQPAVELTGFRHYWQTWNNCGPATLAMNLSYYGSPLDQTDIGSVLRTHKDDKNVMPEELAAYARNQGYVADVRINGSVDLLRLLLSNGIPVLIESWAIPEPDNGMGHYRLLTGYNDEGQYWIGYDSFIAFGLISADGDYRGIRIPYSEMDQLWAAFNRLYVLVYPTAQAPLVQSILGAEFDQNVMWQAALAQGQVTVQQQPDDAFAWFNLGSDFVAFKDYASAANAYDRARQIGLPWRMMWYQFGPFQAYYQIGRYDDILTLTDEVLAKTESIEEIHLWRGWSLKAQGQSDAARQAWQQALDLNPNFTPARDALAQP